MFYIHLILFPSHWVAMPQGHSASSSTQNNGLSLVEMVPNEYMHVRMNENEPSHRWQWFIKAHMWKMSWNDENKCYISKLSLCLN